MKISKKYTSPNFDSRKGRKIDMLVMHYTVSPKEKAIRQLTDPNRPHKVSAHYLIDVDGNIYQLVDEDKRAWHAGVSSWGGEVDNNSRSIGVEIDNPGDRPFTECQLKALEKLSADIIARHDIPLENIVGHSDIAPNRKDDPGPHFPWARLGVYDIGYWPKPSREDYKKKLSLRDYQKGLAKLGYKVPQNGMMDADTKAVIKAFQTRYTPSQGKNRSRRHDHAMLNALLRKFAPEPKAPTPPTKDSSSGDIEKASPKIA